jgi:hypothetical protein
MHGPRSSPRSRRSRRRQVLRQGACAPGHPDQDFTRRWATPSAANAAGCGPSTASAIRRATCATCVYVDSGRRFVITAITWLPGQQSPVHGHYVWCAYGVAEGELTEEHSARPASCSSRWARKPSAPASFAELDLGGPIYHRVSQPLRQGRWSRCTSTALASSSLTTGINRILRRRP